MARLPLVKVTARIHDQEGNPVVGATVTMRLSTVEKYAGMVVPRQTSQATGADGVAVLQVWPNELGSESSEYIVTINYAGNCQSVCGNGGVTKRFHVVVPNRDCNLLDIANLPPYEQRGAGQVLPAEVAYLAAQAANAADRSQNILETMQAAEASFTSLKNLAESAKTAAQQHSANAAKSEANALDAISTINASVSHFENSVVAKTEAKAAELVNSATTTITRAKTAALDEIENKTGQSLTEIATLGAQTLSGARNSIKSAETSALTNIGAAGKDALDNLREEGALFGEDFEAILERAENASKRAACNAAAAANSAEKACKCAERAEIAENNIRAIILDTASSIVSDEIIELAAEKAQISVLQSAITACGPLAKQIITLADRHTKDISRLEREKVIRAQKQQKINEMIIRLV